MEKENQASALQTKYLIAGCSHAALAAMEAIRLTDESGAITAVTREEAPVYSPTILPYVVAGEKGVADIRLREPTDFERLNVARLSGAAVAGVDPAAKRARLEDGRAIAYEKLLIATGADASVPPFPGIGTAPYAVVRTLADALALRERLQKSQSAIVIGAGLIALHTAENLARAGLKTTVVVRRQVSLFAYFDGAAAGMIEKIFAGHGVRLATGSGVAAVAPWAEGGASLRLESGETIAADLLVLAAGVKPRVGFLAGSGVAVEEGVLVDAYMRTSAPDVWAAGDAAQAPGFFDPGLRVNATLPNASVQGRIAGMGMAGDPGVKPYLGSSGLNTFNFFGHHAFSLGRATLSEPAEGIEINTVFLPTSHRYQKLVFENNRLIGVSAINAELDPGVLRELIQRRIDLGPVKADFTRDPLNTGRLLMTRYWR
jgi:phenylglyoxylate dehydrogenase epsilon subunit